MATSLYLINPKTEFPSYIGSEGFAAWGQPGTAFIADLAVVTIAALAPAEFDVRITDEHIDGVDFDADVDFVGLTGKVSQWTRTQEIAAEFRRRGKTVIIGGPYASLSPDVVRPHCDVLVRGEIEEIAEGFFADLAAGSWQDEYEGTRPETLTTPIPRWDLYPNDRALLGCVQASRSCPFECEFCDVITYLGRTQRRKPVERVLAELDALYAHGYRDVLFADDNFTVNRKPCRELLEAVIAWNDRQTDGHMGFVAQVSLDAARDEGLVELCARAGVHTVFVGIETPNEESLREAKKRQNVGRDLNEDVAVFLRNGVTVVGGLIVGFDSDGPGIFKQIREYVESSAIPIFTLGVLVAPVTTPLHARLEAAGRLKAYAGPSAPRTPWDTNVVPLKLSHAKLLEGVRWLGNRIYDPDAFRARMLRYVDALGETTAPGRSTGSGGKLRPAYVSARAILKKLTQLGPGEERMCIDVSRAASKKAGTADHVVGSLLRYAQLHHMYAQGSFWEPAVAGRA